MKSPYKDDNLQVRSSINQSTDEEIEMEDTTRTASISMTNEQYLTF